MFRASTFGRAVAVAAAAACLIAVTRGADSSAISQNPFAPDGARPDAAKPAAAKPEIPKLPPPPAKKPEPKTAEPHLATIIQPVAGPPLPKDASVVERALASPGDLDFVETPLKDVIDWLSDRYKVHVLLDTKALNDAGITPDTPLTARTSGISLDSALHFLLAPKDLAAVPISDDTVLITTADAAKDKVTVVVYKVGDLLLPPAAASEFEKPATDQSSNPDDVINVITSTVSPKDWDTNGGVGSIVPVHGLLAVSQAHDVQQRIVRLFADLRTVRDAPSPPTGKPHALAFAPRPKSTERIQKALESVQDFDFVDTPLGDVIDTVQTKLQIPVQMDVKPLNDAGVTADTPFTLSEKQMRTRVALEHMLGAKDLAFVIEHESLVITTADRAKSVVHPVVYPIGDLCGYSRESATGGPDYDTMIEAITSIVAPTSWDTNGGSGAIGSVPAADAIVVSQTDSVQRQVAELLAKLRTQGCHVEPPAAPAGTPVTRIYRVSGATPPAAGNEEKVRQLIALVRQYVEPKSWQDGSGLITPGPDAIVVRHLPKVQERVEQFLEAFGATPYQQPPPRGYPGGGYSGPSIPANGLLPGMPGQRNRAPSRRPASAMIDFVAPPAAAPSTQPTQQSAPTK